MLSRRPLSLAMSALIAGVLALGAGVSLGSTNGVPNLKGQKLVVADFGGPIHDGWVSAYYGPFSRASKASIYADTTMDEGKAETMVKTSNVSWDVVTTDVVTMNRWCSQGIVQPLPKGFNSSGFFKGLHTNKCSIPVEQYGIVLAYDKSKFPTNPPKTWADFFNLQKYPGKRCMHQFFPQFNIIAALLADGVSPKNLYPFDLNRAFKKLDTIKKDINFVSSGAQFTQIVGGQGNGEVMCALLPGRALTAEKATGKSNWVPVWNGNIRTWDTTAVLKGAPHAKAGQAFLQFMANHPELNAKFTEASGYGATMPAAHPNPDAATKKWLLTQPNAYAVGLDFNHGYWQTNASAVFDAWFKWLNG